MLHLAHRGQQAGGAGVARTGVLEVATGDAVHDLGGLVGLVALTGA